MARHLEHQRDWAKLLALSLEWRKQEPRNGLAWFTSARALAALHRSPEAETAYRRAIECDPGDHLAWSNLGNLMRQNRRQIEAINAYRRALDLDPGYARAWQGAGLSYYAQNGMPGVLRISKKLLATDPELAAAWQALVKTYLGSPGKHSLDEALSLARLLSKAQRDTLFDMILTTD